MKENGRVFYVIGTVLLLCAELAIAWFVHDNVVRPYVGDVLVTVLLCCFCRLFVGQRSKLLPLYVFFLATAVEIGQYFDMVKLLGLSESRFFSTLLGRTFSLYDIVCYAVGCLFFAAGETIVCRIGTKNGKKHCEFPQNIV